VERDAYLSTCGNYRYALERVWDKRVPAVLFIGLNPSIADAEVDDPTLTRCIKFARAWGYGGLLMGNLFGYRATDPKQLTRISDPVGPENDEWLVRLRSGVQLAVAAWGFRGALHGRASTVAERMGKLHCLGTTQSGAPRHPLYVRAITMPVPWTA
jgi:hypothetical protein